MRQAVFEALDDQDETVRNCAAVAVGAIGIGEAEQTHCAVEKRPPDTQISMLFALGKFDLKRQSLDYPVFCEVHRDVAQQAASALGKIRSDKALQELIALLSEKRSGMTWSVVEALGDTRRAIDSLNGDSSRIPILTYTLVGCQRSGPDSIEKIAASSLEDVKRSGCQRAQYCRRVAGAFRFR